MNRWMKWTAPMAALALMVGFSAATKADDAAPPAGKATITVTVVDKSGTPVEGAHVRLLPPHEKHKNKAANDAGTKPPKPQPLAEAVTDKAGKAVLPNIADGTYEIGAGVKGEGMGREQLTVKDGKDASVTITLKEKKHGGPGNGPGTPPPAPDQK